MQLHEEPVFLYGEKNFLWIYSVDFNHGTIVAIIHIADAFFEEICDLHVGEFAFERNRYVEDQVCVGRTFYYAKIVNGKTTVQIAGDFFNLAAYFIDLLVVCDNGINVDGGRTIQFVLKLMLNVVNLIVDDQQISVGGNLSVEGKNQSATRFIISYLLFIE